VWYQRLTPTDIQTFITNNPQPVWLPQPLRLPYQNLGHLVVLQLGHMVFGIDPVGQKLLWEKPLYTGTRPQYQSQVLDPRDGTVKVLYQNNWSQRARPVVRGAHGCCCAHDASWRSDALRPVVLVEHLDGPIARIEHLTLVLGLVPV